MTNGRCYVHGGTTPKGIDSPHFKHGRHTNLPQRLIEQFERSIGDPELLNMTADIGLIDTRIDDLLKRVDSGESGRIYDMLRQQHDTLLKARRGAARTRDEKEKEQYNATAAEALNQIGYLIQRGQGDYQAWNELTNLLEQRRRLVESERKRLLDLQQVVTVKQFIEAMIFIGSSIREHVTDKHARFAITTDIQRILSNSAGTGLPSVIEPD